jgi:hypothetical protein
MAGLFRIAPTAQQPRRLTGRLGVSIQARRWWVQPWGGDGMSAPPLDQHGAGVRSGRESASVLRVFQAVLPPIFRAVLFVPYR